MLFVTFRRTLLLFALTFFIQQSQAQSDKKNEKNGLSLRLHNGPSLKNNNINYFKGGRILFSATKAKKFGITFSNFIDDSRSFQSLGVILEQSLFEWLNSSIGSIGYFNYKENANHVPGITTSTGWQKKLNENFNIYLAYRSDFIFAKKFESLQSLYFSVEINL